MKSRKDSKGKKSSSVSEATSSSLVSTEKQVTNRRRKHKNSKNGCPNCKKRRVKCSEDLPSCQNCIKHKIRCGYLDYSEEQLTELKKSKNAEKNNDNQIEASDPLSGSKLPTSSSSLAEGHKSLTTNSSASDNQILNERDGQLDQHAISESSTHSSHPDMHPQILRREFNDILGPGHSGGAIIYPVYSLKRSSVSSPEANNERDNLVQFSTEKFNNTGNISGNYDTLCGLENDFFNTSVGGGAVLHDSSLFSRALPGAHKPTQVFKHSPRVRVNYDKTLTRVIRRYAPEIVAGTCSLENIKYVYYSFLSSFMYESCRSSLVFNCLLYFAANFMSIYVEIEQAASNFIRVLEVSGNQNRSSIQSIRYYAQVIKDLRNNLNQGSEIDNCSCASYLLSLTSIYDKGATYQSAGCFRDGLFSVLSHTISVAKEKNIDLLRSTPVYFRLMLNIEMTVYFPAYNPELFKEIKNYVDQFSELLNDTISRLPYTGLSDDDVNNIGMMKNVTEELTSFVNDSLIEYIPVMIKHADNIELQEHTLFKMLHRWIQLCPPRIVVSAKHMDPIEKVLYLVVRLVSKALLAIFPQTKFFFLRDFDSPLMIDVYDINVDFRAFKYELANPVKSFFTLPLYKSQHVKYQIIASQSIRIISFLQKRLNFIYRQVVYNEDFSVEVKDIASWRKSIRSIEAARKFFIESVQFKETNLINFSSSLIKEINYPSIMPEKSIADSPIQVPEHIDFFSLGNNGLLEHDFDNGF